MLQTNRASHGSPVEQFWPDSGANSPAWEGFSNSTPVHAAAVAATAAAVQEPPAHLLPAPVVPPGGAGTGGSWTAATAAGVLQRAGFGRASAATVAAAASLCHIGSSVTTKQQQQQQQQVLSAALQAVWQPLPPPAAAAAAAETEYGNHDGDGGYGDLDSGDEGDFGFLGSEDDGSFAGWDAAAPAGTGWEAAAPADDVWGAAAAADADAGLEAAAAADAGLEAAAAAADAAAQGSGVGCYGKNQQHSRVQLASILREVCRHAQPAAGGLSAADKLLEIKRRSGRSTKGARLQVKDCLEFFDYVLGVAPPPALANNAAFAPRPTPEELKPAGLPRFIGRLLYWLIVGQHLQGAAAIAEWAGYAATCYEKRSSQWHLLEMTLAAVLGAPDPTSSSSACAYLSSVLHLPLRPLSRTQQQQQLQQQALAAYMQQQQQQLQQQAAPKKQQLQPLPSAKLLQQPAAAAARADQHASLGGSSRASERSVLRLPDGQEQATAAAALQGNQIRKHNLRGRSSKRSYSSMAAGLE